MKIKKVGVVGCGLMGSGIVQVCAQSGYQVIVSEVNNELLNKGLTTIKNFLADGVERGKITEQDKDSTLGRIQGATDISGFSDCDLVIEAAAEDLELKKKIFANLDKVCPKEAILSTNTSVLSIIDMARMTSRPEKVAGVHFAYPVPIMRLLEIIQTIATSNETLETVKQFGATLGKVIVVAKDTPGFIVNRLLTPFLNNAIRMVEDGIATKEDIDTAIKVGLNHPMGPLELIDLLGIDTGLRAATALYEELKEPQHAPPILMKRMVAAGWYGRKTSKGFYDYK